MMLSEEGHQLQTPQQAVVMLRDKLASASRERHEIQAQAANLAAYSSDLEGMLLTKESEVSPS